ncbi:uncharacterized protein LOC116853601 [Odontomachus brunneus]|uniref:uncharacterized protein LOC116853601 n=1 Tax=Odontomachus brunneus TaxID=486640 RepID=UPI0013F1CB82|nr:uncharacterized protein LOC116853601 [Odontomachus brunneus]
MESALGLYDVLCENSKLLKYVPYYKISQDHIELLFSSFRRHRGCNNNPTARQLKAAFKKILVHADVKNVNAANCISLEEIAILHILEYSEYVIEYIAECIVMQLQKMIFCEPCKDALIRIDGTKNNLVSTKSFRGLVQPSVDIIRICQQCEKVFRHAVNSNIQLNTNYICFIVLEYLLNTDIFKHLENYTYDQMIMENHVIHLLRNISQKYVKIRLHHYAATIKDKSNSNRHEEIGKDNDGNDSPAEFARITRHIRGIEDVSLDDKVDTNVRNEECGKIQEYNIVLWSYNLLQESREMVAETINKCDMANPY